MATPRDQGTTDMTSPMMRAGAAAASSPRSSREVISWPSGVVLAYVFGVVLTVALFALPIGLMGLSIIVRLADGSTGDAIILAIGLIIVLGILGVFTWSTVRWLRAALILEDDAVTIRGLIRTTRIPWSHVARIEQARGGYWRQATQVVTHDGRRHSAIVTSYQYLLFRGEPFDARARDPRIPQIPTQKAIAAHQHWLRTHSSPPHDDRR